jgi:RNA polymerase sigma-70 factor (ECF subfamily)
MTSARSLTTGQRTARADSLSTVPVSSELPVLPGVATGDADAVAELWSRYAGRVRALGLNLSSYDPSFADDLVQETFTRLWRSAARFNPALGSEPTFVFTVARRAAVDLWRRSRRSTADRSLDADDPSSAHEATGTTAQDDAIDQVLTGWVVGDALSSLTANQREVIELAYYGQLSQTEIADRLGIPLGTVKTRTFAALKTLRVALDQRGVLS